MKFEIEWAWRRKKREYVDHFKKTQHKWTLGSLAVLAAIPLFVFVFLFFMLSLMKSTEAYRMSYDKVAESSEVRSRLGTPIESGLLVSGSFNTTGPVGSSYLSYSVKGSDGEASVYVDAKKERGRWVIECLEVVYADEDDSTFIVPCD